MNDNNENMDPIVGFRRSLRHLALNTDTLLLVRDRIKAINQLEDNVTIMMLLIAFVMRYE